MSVEEPGATASNSAAVRWVSVTTDISEQHAQTLEEALYAVDAQSVALSDAGDTPLFEPGVNQTPLWKQNHLQALFSYPEELVASNTLQQTLKDLEKEVLSAIQPFPELEELAFSFELVEDLDWVRVCLDQFEAIEFSNGLRITPSWKKGPSLRSDEVLLDPGLAFGTGTHATTHLCLDWLDRHRPDNISVIDFGCGSGILGIAALKLGARFVRFVDNDPQALIATRQNIDLNGIASSRFEIALSDDSMPPSQLESAGFDLVLANILASTLIALSDKLAGLCKPEGKILLSGILADQGAQVIEEFAGNYQHFVETAHEGWLRIAASRCG